MFPAPFTFIFYLVYTNYITPGQKEIGPVKNDADDINQNSFKFFDELACRPECRLMRVRSAVILF